MARYVAIEHDSGLVWGEDCAETASEACSAIDMAASGQAPRKWHQVSPVWGKCYALHLYAVTDPNLEDVFFEATMAHEVKMFCEYVGDYRPDAELDL